MNWTEREWEEFFQDLPGKYEASYADDGWPKDELVPLLCRHGLELVKGLLAQNLRTPDFVIVFGEELNFWWGDRTWVKDLVDLSFYANNPSHEVTYSYAAKFGDQSCTGGNTGVAEILNDTQLLELIANINID